MSFGAVEEGPSIEKFADKDNTVLRRPKALSTHKKVQNYLTSDRGAGREILHVVAPRPPVSRFGPHRRVEFSFDVQSFKQIPFSVAYT